MSRLLKSWATPPASRPIASIFCAWRSCSSVRALGDVFHQADHAIDARAGVADRKVARAHPAQRAVRPHQRGRFA